MDLSLPMDQFRFNLLLWILITTYGVSAVGNFIAFIPGFSDEDAEMLRYTDKSYFSFWLVSSLLFLLLGISQFQYMSLIYLTMVEVYIIIGIYMYLIIKKLQYSIKHKNKLKEIKGRRKN